MSRHAKNSITEKSGTLHCCTEVNDDGEICGGLIDTKKGYMILPFCVDDDIPAYPCMKCGRLYRYAGSYEKFGQLIPAFRVSHYSDDARGLVNCQPYFLIEVQGEKFPDFYLNDDDQRRKKSSRMGDHFYERYVKPTLKK